MIFLVTVILGHAAKAPFAATDVERTFLARHFGVLTALGLSIAVGPADFVGRDARRAARLLAVVARQRGLGAASLVGARSVRCARVVINRGSAAKQRRRVHGAEKRGYPKLLVAIPTQRQLIFAPDLG